MKKSRVFKSIGCFFKISWFVFVCLVSVLLSRFLVSGINDMLAVGKEPDIVQIELADEATIDEVSQILLEKNVISEKWFFKIYCMVTKAPKGFAAGVYEVETGMDYQSIINHMKNNDKNREVVEVTVTEGMNVLDCAALMDKNGVCNKDEFLKACNTGKFEEKYTFLKDVKNLSSRVYKLEGYLFPDTYKFYRDEKPINVISKILSNYQKRIYEKTDIEDYPTKVSVAELAENQKISLDDLTNLASLIQAEAANKEDMYGVSAVIHNRLATMETGGKSKFGEFTMNLLRIDATIYYPYKNEASVPSNMKATFKSDYNTYKTEGLPKGPICNPGLDAFYAALFPSKTDYYYYCHSASGETFFAKTKDAHVANMRKAGLT